MAAYPFNRLSGPANVLVMPAFHSASISTKMLQELGGATVIGPLLVGLDKPVQIVNLSAKDSDLVNMAAIAAYNVSASKAPRCLPRDFPASSPLSRPRSTRGASRTRRDRPSSRAFCSTGGCDGLNVLGTTGEATSFSLEQRKRVMSAYKDAGLPLDRLMVGTGAAATADAVALTRHAADLGFAGALVLPPFYYKGVPDDGLAAYIATIVQATAEKPIPIYLYHFPSQSGLPWHVKLIARLLDAHRRRIVGPEGFLRRMAYAREAAGIAKGFEVFPSTEAASDGSALGHLRRLHLGDRKPQRRSLPAGVARGRCGRARQGGHDPQAVRRQAAGVGHQVAARAYPQRRRLGAGGAAARAIPGRRPRGASSPDTTPRAAKRVA